MNPRDQQRRDEFAKRWDENYSVIAPAGVGKTTSIVNRVIEIASRQPDWLPSLVVVTYTNRAADEMQQRARAAILKAGVDATVLAAFNRAFFGTIHSFCLRLLRQHGHRLGLPASLELATNEEALWLEFVRQLPGAGGDDQLFRYVSMLDVIEMGRYLQPERVVPASAQPCPKSNLDAVLAFPAKGRGAENVLLGQKRIREWQAACAGNAEFAPLPVIDAGGAKFVEVWNEATAPLRAWLGERALATAREVAAQYRAYRLAQGLITFDDQVALAALLLRDAGVREAIRAENYRVILDEAQDADPLQFEVLRAVAGGAGAFSMVGDPQQSIYGSRANLHQYRDVHRQLTELRLDVTFRCDAAIVGAVNALAPAMLNNAAGQVEYVPLEARPGATAGQVVRWSPETEEVKEDWNSAQCAAYEARQLAAWLKAAGLKKLRARDWSEVAVLCPLKRWFGSLRRELIAAGLDVQVQSHRDVNGDSPAYAWLTALVVAMAEPRNSYEIVGVLREVFGISDQTLADFCEGHGERFQIETETAGNGEVPAALTLLARARAEVLRLPVRDGVRRLVAATLLRERLVALPDDDGRDLAGELDDLRVRAATAEADGASWHDWATKLREDFGEPRESEAPRPGAIQIITCQKAKGLEWDAVIVPFFFRSIQMRRGSYPVVVERDGVPVRAAFSKADLTGEEQDALKQKGRQELQRVLYVSMTRARRTLVVVDDEKLFDRQSGSFADLLGTKRPAWDEIPTKLAAEPKPTPAEPVAPSVTGQWPEMTTAERTRAVANDGKFVRRVLPHRLAARYSDEETERRREPEPEFAGGGRERGVRYGVWWHELMSAMPWHEGPAAWTAKFRAAVAGAPDAERAEKEWARFERSELAKLLSDKTLIVQPEMSFLASTAGECVEGFIDLAAFDERSRQWWVVDWKTDRAVDELVREYGAQLRAYTHALKKTTGCAARARLYATVTGQLLEVH